MYSQLFFSGPGTLYGHALSGVRVQRVQKMQRVQRVKVGALLEIWGRHYDKTREPPWRAGEKRHPPLVAAPPPFPKGKHVTGFSVVFGSLQHGYHRLTGFSDRLGSPTNPVRWSDSSSLATRKRWDNKWGRESSEPFFAPFYTIPLPPHAIRCVPLSQPAGCGTHGPWRLSERESRSGPYLQGPYRTLPWTHRPQPLSGRIRHRQGRPL